MQEPFDERIGLRTDGMSADDGFQGYAKRNDSNVPGQQSGYTKKASRIPKIIEADPDAATTQVGQRVSPARVGGGKKARKGGLSE